MDSSNGAEPLVTGLDDDSVACPESCGFERTWHASHCCHQCRSTSGREHGFRCERQRVGAAAFAANAKCRGIMYGFLPCVTYVVASVSLTLVLTVRWARAGLLHLSDIPLSDVGSASDFAGNDIRWVLITRFASIAICMYIITDAVWKRRGEASAKDSRLPLGGGDVLVTFTMVSWMLMCLYFSQATLASVAFCFGCLPPQWFAAALWIQFEVLWGFACLVWSVCWFVLIPSFHLAGAKAAVKLLLKRQVLMQHNANILLMVVELVVSKWNVNELHAVFCVYLGAAYVIFNWWLHSKIHFWIYFFLNYDRPMAVPSLVLLQISACVTFLIGQQAAGLVGK
eukprot:TRINITY_DN22776_c0_g1_i1.p1 TRINITY_DN22776_c0_g1~~TRINITY_DN22776_c0_g1_i1.p1  ORF type:complete len:360 (-),score=32.05 TRINITY_DN22776_c0_g1_i1:60-1079(-)